VTVWDRTKRERLFGFRGAGRAVTRRSTRSIFGMETVSTAFGLL
jgi:hypothetical protein